jgi:hypothetical protein
VVVTLSLRPTGKAANVEVEVAFFTKVNAQVVRVRDAPNIQGGGIPMTTVKTFLVTAICGLVLFGAVTAQALGAGEFKGAGGPDCLESPDVRVFRPCPPPR